MKNCPFCNAVNADENKFCDACGKEFTEAVNDYVPPVAEPQAVPTQPMYQQAPYQVNENMLPEEFKPVTVGAYIGYSILFSIPLVGFIMLLVTAFSSSNKKSLRNYARAMLIMYVVAFVIAFAMTFVLGSAMSGLYY